MMFDGVIGGVLVPQAYDCVRISLALPAVLLLSATMLWRMVALFFMSKWRWIVMGQAY